MEPSANAASVLVVEDHTDSRELLALYLRSVGCIVATASNGAEALARAEVMRPHMDGWETTRRVKSDTSLRDVVVIAVTAHGFPADVQRAMQAGCEGVVVKPYDLGALAGQVQRVMAQRQRVQS